MHGCVKLLSLYLLAKVANFAKITSCFSHKWRNGPTRGWMESIDVGAKKNTGVFLYCMKLSVWTRWQKWLNLPATVIWWSLVSPNRWLRRRFGWHAADFLVSSFQVSPEVRRPGSTFLPTPPPTHQLHAFLFSLESRAYFCSHCFSSVVVLISPNMHSGTPWNFCAEYERKVAHSAWRQNTGAQCLIHINFRMGAFSFWSVLP